MKHVMMSSAWEFGTDPFPAYRANLVYGRNKRDREFLPVQGMAPSEWAVCLEGYPGRYEYRGPDKAEAERVMAAWLAKGSGFARPRVVPCGALPAGKFRVIRTKEKGTVLVVPGSDDSNRCLLFVGCAGGFRGGESVLKDGTTGTILKECSAGNACESSTEVIVLLEPGQSVAFHTFGRRTNEVYLYTWNGAEVEKKHFSKSEWDNRNAVATPPIEDAEVL